MPPRSAPTHTVRVHVGGTIDVPLNLGMLEELHDPQLARDIMLESVKLGVAERLGYFDSMTISTEPDPSAPAAGQAKGGTLSCSAELDLEKLGDCVVAIQEAYNRVLAHVSAVRDMLAHEDEKDRQEGAGVHQQNAEEAAPAVPACGDKACELRRAAMLTVLDAMLQGPTSVVEAAAATATTTTAAAAEAAESPNEAETATVNGSGSGADGGRAAHENAGDAESENGNADWDYRRDDPEANGYRPLLQEADDDDDEEEEDDADMPDEEGEAGPANDMDYAKMGYTAL